MKVPMGVLLMVIIRYVSLVDVATIRTARRDQHIETIPSVDCAYTSAVTPTELTKSINETEVDYVFNKMTQGTIASPNAHELITGNNKNITDTTNPVATTGNDASPGNRSVRPTEAVTNKLSECLSRHLQSKTIFCCPPYNENLNLDSLRPKGITWASMIVDFWFSIVLCFCGLIGNILAFIILSKEKTNTSIFILKVLAFVDGTYCLWYLMFDPYLAAYQNTSWIKHRDTKSVHWVALNKHYLGFVNRTLQLLSSWLVVLLTLDRYIVVCKPFRASSLCTLTKARIEVFCIVICCICYNIPTCFVQESYMSVNPCTGVPVGMRRLTLFGNSYGYGIVYSMIFEGFIKYIIPVVSVLVMNSLLVSALRKAAVRRRALVTSGEKNTQTQSDNLTLVLTLVAFMFLLLILPGMGVKIVQILYYFHRSEKIVLNVDIMGFSYGLAYCVLIISNLFLRINSSINFIIYTLASARFRRGLFELFRCKMAGDKFTQNDGAFTNGNTSNSRNTAMTTRM